MACGGGSTCDLSVRRADTARRPGRRRGVGRVQLPSDQGIAPGSLPRGRRHPWRSRRSGTWRLGFRARLAHVVGFSEMLWIEAVWSSDLRTRARPRRLDVEGSERRRCNSHVLDEARWRGARAEEDGLDLHRTTYGECMRTELCVTAYTDGFWSQMRRRCHGRSPPTSKPPPPACP